MYESAKQYKEIVAREVAALQNICRCSINDGEPGRCPRCGMQGVWDIANIGMHMGYGNSIYYSTVFNEWRCRICDIGPDNVMIH